MQEKITRSSLYGEEAPAIREKDVGGEIRLTTSEDATQTDLGPVLSPYDSRVVANR